MSLTHDWHCALGPERQSVMFQGRGWGVLRRSSGTITRTGEVNPMRRRKSACFCQNIKKGARQLQCTSLMRSGTRKMSLGLVHERGIFHLRYKKKIAQWPGSGNSKRSYFQLNARSNNPTKRCAPKRRVPSAQMRRQERATGRKSASTRALSPAEPWCAWVQVE